MSERGGLPPIGLLQTKYDLHNSPEVTFAVRCASNRGEAVPNDPAATIGHYLTSLAEGHSLFNPDVRDAELRRRAQVEQHVIKDEDIPRGYYEMQQRIAREQGFGDVDLDENIVRRMNFVVRADQRTSLKRWVDYLSGASGEEAPFPAWFKYYTYRNVTQLTNYDREKGLFRKRSRGTTAIFPELNVEALSFVYSTLEAKLNNENIEDRTTADLAAGANFAKLYAHAIEKVQSALSPELMKEIEGSWVKYTKSVDPEVGKSLARSLEGKGTGWCVAGESTARGYLSNGDFYVYYTKDASGMTTIPRLAIRMQNNTIAEVRGIIGGDHEGENANQAVEPLLAGVLDEKLQELPGSELYFKKLQDMRELTRLEKIITKSPAAELTVGELRFLYELDTTIQGFGYGRDPRILELRALRPDATQDIAKAYNHTFEEGSFDIREVQALLLSGQAERVIKGLETFHGLSAEIAERLIKEMIGNVEEYEAWAEHLWQVEVNESMAAWPGVYALHAIRAHRNSFSPSMQLGMSAWESLTNRPLWPDEYEKLLEYVDLFSPEVAQQITSQEQQALAYNGSMLEHLGTPDMLKAYKQLNTDTAKWLIKEFDKEDGWVEQLGENLTSFDEEAKDYIATYLASASRANTLVQRAIANEEDPEEVGALIARAKDLDVKTANELCRGFGAVNENTIAFLEDALKAFDTQGQKLVSRHISRLYAELEDVKAIDWSELDDDYLPLNG